MTYNEIDVKHTIPEDAKLTHFRNLWNETEDQNNGENAKINDDNGN